MTPFALLLIVFLMAALLVLVWLALGVRISSNPTCRACGASLALLGEPPSACPSCARSLEKSRSVRFRGRRRPLGLWVLATVIFLPAAGLLTIFILLLTGTVRPSTLEQMVNPTPINGPISYRQAQGLSTEKLLRTLQTYPDGPWGWSELHERMRANTPGDQEMIEVINTIDAAIPALAKNTKNAGANPGYDCGQTLLMATNQLGYNHPRVQEFLRAHLSMPTHCPTINVRSSLLQLYNLPSPFDRNQPAIGSALHHFAGVLENAVTTTAVRIDGKEIPQRLNGRIVWNPRGSNSIGIRKRYVPEAFEPGTHKIELDRTVAILPDGVSQDLKQEFWPKNVITSSCTIACESTVEDPSTVDP